MTKGSFIVDHTEVKLKFDRKKRLQAYPSMRRLPNKKLAESIKKKVDECGTNRLGR